MDFNWTPYFSTFWIFPLLCLLFMAAMMLTGHCMPFRFGHGAGRDDGRETGRQILDRRYANGEIGKEQYEALRRDLDG
jgi:putative membrane protein